MIKDKIIIPSPPEPPLCRILIQGNTRKVCTKCGSSTIGRFWLFGRNIGCIQPKCENYHKNSK